ncbi:hypothetical protein EVAR_6160_1 [Eumeta japonica]|uniref:Uncharacterized protein n=1 Tax=Eumeta variegata TaxID=151549 RepID=A0A4C1THC8_EUMVA|nr:hypothetical protein EVAR_6160_1 [Eumeta japonica]
MNLCTYQTALFKGMRATTHKVKTSLRLVSFKSTFDQETSQEDARIDRKSALHHLHLIVLRLLSVIIHCTQSHVYSPGCSMGAHADVGIPGVLAFAS